ncbi:MAG: GEVED domain-containing protein [Saprospiraceae bacterium]
MRPSATDGVVVTYSSVGSLAVRNPDGGNYDAGRTATHEVGHWLNLYHTWGDDDDEADTCSGTDLVADTPNQALPSSGCPPFPSISCGNGSNGDMHMNYMDYSDDNCLQMFSMGQSTRMRAVLENSGGRVSLMSSLGCVAPGICYCAAGSDDLAPNEKIGNVTFSDISQSSTSNAGYENFILVTGNIEQSATYSLSVTISNAFSTDQVLAWIDYNQNGDFTDAGEQVMVSSIGTVAFSTNVTIPATASLGETRMRIRLHDTTLGPNAASCGFSSYGQVEDYTLQISAALPVEFVNFEVKETIGNRALIQWSTANERNVKDFSVEMMDAPSHEFRSIGRVAPTAEQSYQFTTDRLVAGNYYFRIKETDFEGQATYTNIKSLRIGNDVPVIRVVPNPVHDGVASLQLGSPILDNSAVLQIINQLGIVCTTMQLDQGTVQASIPTAGLPSGTYFVQLITKDGIVTTKVMVQE